MKCDELHVASLFEFEKVLKGKSNKLFYAKADVDAAFTELKEENKRLKEDLYRTDHHNIQYFCMMYGCKNVEEFHGEIKNLQTKLIATERALWLARALAISRVDVDKYIRTHMMSKYWKDGDEIFVFACEKMKTKINQAKEILIKKAEEYK